MNERMHKNNNIINGNNYSLIDFFPSFFPFADNELYSGTVADFSGSDPIIYREPLQTEQYDSLSLNGKICLFLSQS